jgi:phytanoyl-CoA hydroxylase
VGAGDCLILHPRLPHGGGVIRDKSKTRCNIVMHTTPEGVPVYHQDAFFRPNTPYFETPR